MTKEQRIGVLFILAGSFLILRGIELHIQRVTGQAESEAYYYRDPGFAYKWDQAKKMSVKLVKERTIQ